MAFVCGRESDVKPARLGFLRSDRPRALLKRILGAVLAAGCFLAAAPALAQAPCTRADLQAAADNFITAQTAGDPTKLHMTLWLDYNEQLESASFSTGILSKPLKIDFHRDLLDTASCTTFTEAVVTDPAHPYVLGVMLSDRGGDLGAISTLFTDHDNGWLFNPANTLKYSRAENWSEIPPAERDSRETLIAAANAYLDLFNNKTVSVPWGTPCERLEGGLYTGKGEPGVSAPDDSCNVGVPSGVKIVNRTYVVDDVLGAVAVLSNFGPNALPDAHTFRIEKGKIRYVHTITVCKTFNCGFKTPPQLQASAGG
jgi:hypothetical protein